VCITGVWDKNKVNEKKEPTVLMTSIDSFEQADRRWRSFRSHPDVKLAMSSEQVASLEEKDLPGEGIEFQDTSHGKKEIPLGMQRLAMFILNQHEKDENAIPLDQMSVEDIERYLRDYPNQETVQKLRKIEKEGIVELLKDPKIIDELNVAREKIIDEIDHSENKKKQFLDNVMNRISSLGIEDMQEFVKVRGKIEVEDGAIRVKGSGAVSYDNDFTKVEGEDGAIDLF
jgi:hypothetical protein